MHPTQAAEVHEIVHRICLRTGARVEEIDDLERGVSGADFVYADTWVRLGEPIESWRARVARLRPYRIDSAVLAATKNPGVRFLHCLPAVHDNSTSVGAAVLAETGLRGAEVSDEVFHSSASLVFQQAENRMHHNPEYGRATRIFPYAPAHVLVDSLLTELVLFDLRHTGWPATVLKRPIHAGVHFVNLAVDSPCEVAVSSPNRLRQDGGTDSVYFVHLFDHSNITGGENLIAKPTCAGMAASSATAEQTLDRSPSKRR